MGNVINNQERFDGVHIGVTATVIFRLAKGFVPGLKAHLLFFTPEVFLNHFYGVIQQFSGFRVPGRDGAGRTQQGEEVLITLFRGIHHALIVNAGIPAAVFFIAQRAVQGFDAVIDQIISARSAHRRRHGINVQHTRRDPKMGAHLFFDLPFISQPAEACRHRGVFTEIKDAVGFLLQPAVVAQRVKPFHSFILVLTTFCHHFIDDLAQTLQFRRGNIT
ncbi:Uncharacterised protein [Salmonella enterica subsp. enterica serovar Typhi]|nr:Uncharacterised protein [Salmonella enterica subsp. enterica serovar Typhi]CRF61306.1 Uncharacterised protein [Salmonella enterica subsp. enterica serovar Typhi]